jgi:hypothetical protein
LATEQICYQAQARRPGEKPLSYFVPIWFINAIYTCKRGYVMADEFDGQAQSTLTPSENAFAVIPHDTLPLAAVTKYLYVGGTGRVTLRAMESSADVVFENVPAGAYLYVRASHVRSTGTTATAIVGCA